MIIVKISEEPNNFVGLLLKRKDNSIVLFDEEELNELRNFFKEGFSPSSYFPKSEQGEIAQSGQSKDEVKDNWGNVVTGDEKEIKEHLDKNYPDERKSEGERG